MVYNYIRIKQNLRGGTTMKCVKYKIYSKKTGRLIIEDIGWYDNNTNVYELLKKEFSKFDIVLCK